MDNLGTGIANGIAAGMQGYAQGQRAGLQMRQGQDSQRMKQQLFAKQMEQMQYQQDTQTPLDQVKQAQAVQAKQNKLLSAKLTKQLTYDAFKGYNTDGDVKHLNQALKDLSEISPGMYTPGAVVMKIDPENDKQLVNQLIQKGVIKKWGPNASKSFLKVIEPGNQEPTVMDINQFQAATGYTKYMTDQEQAELIKRVAIAKDSASVNKIVAETKKLNLETQDVESWLKANPTKTYTDYKNQGKQTTGASLKDEYANLQVKKEKGILDKDSSIRLKVLDKLFSTDSDEKRKILGKGLEIVDKYKDTLFNSKITKDDVINAKLYTDQSGIKIDTKTSKELKDQYNILLNGKRLSEEISKLDNEEVSRGIYDIGLQKVKQLFNDDKFNSSTPEEKAKVLKSIEMNTKLGMFLAKYIKSISGAAVSDNEFARLRDLFSGSVFNNTQTLKTGVTAFVNELDTQFKDASKTNLLNDPATTLDVVRMYTKEFNNTKEFSNTKSVDNSKPVIAVNPNTGEKLQLVNGQWEPMK